MTDRKQEILDAALRGFAEKGLAGTTVEEVRDPLGRLGRLDLPPLRRQAGHRGRPLRRDPARLPGGPARASWSAPATLADTVEELVRHHLRWVAADRDRARFLLGGRPPRAVDEIRELNRRAFRATAGWLDEQVAAGRIRPIPFDLFYAVLIGPAQEFCRHWLEGRLRTSMRTAERELAAAAWGALSVPTTKEATDG